MPLIIGPNAIAGIQDKASASMLSLPAQQAGNDYILKLNPPEYDNLVENEFLFLDKAKSLGIPVASATMIHDRDDVPGLLVQRFDRRPRRDGGSTRLAMEDTGQVLDLAPADKYRVSAEDLGAAVSNMCAARPLAARNVYLQFLFAWLTGNGDLHAKNISVLNADAREWAVSPIYDVTSTLPYGDKSMALTICGKDRKLARSDWLEFAGHLSCRGVLRNNASKRPPQRQRYRPANCPLAARLPGKQQSSFACDKTRSKNDISSTEGRLQTMKVPTSKRLRFRQMIDSDGDSLLSLLGDPAVMRHYPAPKSRDQVQRWIDWNTRNYADHGFGLWIIEDHDGTFIGECGLTVQTVDGMAEVEVGYHVMAAAQGNGFGTEAASASRRFAERRGISTLIAIINPANTESKRVADKIGLRFRRQSVVHGLHRDIFSANLDAGSDI